MDKNRQGWDIRQTQQSRVIKINTKGRTKESTTRNNEQRKQSQKCTLGLEVNEGQQGTGELDRQVSESQLMWVALSVCGGFKIRIRTLGMI